MKIIYSEVHQSHQPRYEIYEGKPTKYPEVAARAEAIITELQSRGIGPIIRPGKFPASHIYSLHQKQYVDFLRSRCSRIQTGTELYPSHFISDTYAPLTNGTYRASVDAVNCALTGAFQVVNGESVIYSLCRPPGHHAEHHSMGGYCYFNNAAIAAQYLSGHGKVAVLDIDFHHGNGTQSFFYDRSDVLFASIHANPKLRYPYSSGFKSERGSGAGKGFNFNFPVPINIDDESYLRTLNSALSQVKNFRPDYLVVSAGFDTFSKDPVGGFKLTREVYGAIGEQIASLGLATLIIQEGGYDIENLGYITAEFLSAF